MAGGKPTYAVRHGQVSLAETVVDFGPIDPKLGY